MGVKPFQWRLAELWVVNKRRELTPEEMTEFQHCLSLNAKYCWEMAYLENMSLMASLINDVDWQHEICLEIDHLELTGKRKKPAPKKDTGKKKD